MTWIATVCAGVAVASTAACQRSADMPAGVSALYRSDIDNVCNAMVRSGADRLEPSGRAVTIAMWIAPQLKTQEARDYLVRIQPLVGGAKVAALETEARRVGLTECPLANEWRGPT